jgi:hypothetical protein
LKKSQKSDISLGPAQDQTKKLGFLRDLNA